MQKQSRRPNVWRTRVGLPKNLTRGPLFSVLRTPNAAGTACAATLTFGLLASLPSAFSQPQSNSSSPSNSERSTGSSQAASSSSSADWSSDSSIRDSRTPSPALDSSIGIRQSAFEPDTPPSVYAAPPSPFTSALPGAVLLPGFAQEVVDNPLQWGPFRVIPAVSYRFSYSTGLPNSGQQSDDEETVQHTIGPSLTLLSEHLALNYSPSLNYYSKGRYEDSLDHFASIRANFGYDDWRFGFSHSYANSSEVLVETAVQTDTQTHSTAIIASGRLSDRTSMDLSASQSINDTSSYNSSKTWSSMNWIDHQVTDVTRLGVGVGGGYTDVDEGSDMTYEQIQGRVLWQPRPKISVALNGGVDIRQFLGEDGAPDQLYPITGATASYQPFDYTSLSLAANRGVSSSIFTDQVTETISVSLTLSQRLFQHLNASLSGGTRFAEYESSSSLISVDRSDDIIFFSASLGTRIFRRAILSVSYSHTINESTDDTFSYDSHTVSAQISYSF